jgi:hypothetical protein
MKLFTLPALLAAALFSAVVVIPFLPAARPRPQNFVLEARVASSVAGTMRIYYDLGRGYNETDSVACPLAKSDIPQLCRLPVPAGGYQSIRLDPLEGAGTVTFEGPLRIVSARGRVRHTLALSTLQPLEQIASRRETNGRLEVVIVAPANDPQLVVRFSPALRIDLTPGDYLDGLGWRALVVFGVLSTLLFGLDRARRAQAALVHAGRWLALRPARAVMIAAAGAVVASTYPVVFLGQSHVSPNFGTALLYEALPTLPGYDSRAAATVNGSDVGATIWAHVPYSFIQHRALAGGELPLWNRYTATGTPLLAQGQSMFGDPLHLFVVAARGAAWAWDVKYLVSKWLFAAGLGLIVLAVAKDQATKGPKDQETTDAKSPLVPSSLGPLVPAFVSPLVPALLVSAAAPFIGFYLFRINHPAIFSLGYAPWVLYAWVRLAQADHRRVVAWSAAALFVANLALLNSGTVKEAYMLLLQMNLAGAGIVLTRLAPWRVRLARLAVAVWAGGLVLLVALPGWATFLQTLPNAYTASPHANASQIQPALLLGVFDELFYRPLSQGDMVFNPALNFFLLLGGLYFAATLRVQLARRTAVVLALAAVAALSFAFGVVPASWVIEVPLLAHVGHIDNCFSCGFLVFGSVLAGLGFATAATRLGTAEGRADLVIAAALLFALVAAWIGFRQAAHRMVYGAGTVVTVVQSGEVIAVNPFIWGSLAALLLASIGLALVARRAFTRGVLGPGGALVAALCVIVLLWRQGMHVAAVGFENYVLQPPVRAGFHATSPAVEFVRAAHRAEPARVFGLQGVLTPGWNAVYGLETVHGPDALQTPWLRQLFEASRYSWGSSWKLYVTPENAGQARPLLDAMNVRYYLDHAAHRGALSGVLKLAHAADLDVFESSTAWSRAFFTDRLDVYADPADLVKKIVASKGRPFAAVATGQATAQPALARLVRDGAARTVAPATQYRLTENTTAFAVRATGPGVVVLSEAWWPDSFRVDVNGRPASIVRVNHAFKGVLIEAAGNYSITFSYWPRRFTRHLMFSAIGTVLAIGSFLIALRPARIA